jgi:hypothetical protein
MWDAWAAYEPKGSGYFVTEKHRAEDVLAAREAAISYAAYRLLLWRASYDANMGRAFDRLTATLRSFATSPGFVSVRGDSPAALGNRIAAAAIAFGRSDGSLERQHYIDPSYVPVNEPLVVSQPGATMHDRTFWQPSHSARSSSREACPSLRRLRPSSVPNGGTFAASLFRSRRTVCPSTLARRPLAILLPRRTSRQR